MNVRISNSIFFIGLLFAASVSYAQEYPAPVSESVEKSKPGTMTFFSYPKYYPDESGKLQLTDTTLRLSDDPDWDYEVTTGIWRLFVSRDGRFQAHHKGDVFTYRFSSLGYGRGSQFQAVDLGKPDFNNFEVNGDRIRWLDVFENVDVEVRYIPDVMKVDVILRNSFMRDLKDVLQKGEINSENYLTARFDIEAVMLTSEVKQNGEKVNPYAENLNLDQSLVFEKDGETVHHLRPAETYLLDAEGKQVIDEEIRFRTANRWQLREDGPGLAELSVFLADLQDLPDGDLVIDPNMEFDYNDGIQDTRLAYQSSSYYGMSTSLIWNNNDHLLFGFDVDDLDVGASIVSASLELYETYKSAGDVASARIYKVTNAWSEYNSNWYNRTSSNTWDTSGGDYAFPAYCSKAQNLPSSSNQWIEFDVTQALKSHFVNAKSDIENLGFLAKMTSSTGACWYVCCREYSINYTRRPILHVTYRPSLFGADVGNSTDEQYYGIEDRQNHMYDDDLEGIRLFVGDLKEEFRNFISEAKDNDRKVIPVFACGVVITNVSAHWIVQDIIDENTNRYTADKDGYVDWILYRMNYIDDQIPGAIGDTIQAIELGNEEECKWWSGEGNPPEYWYGNEIDGASFAEYYLEAFDAIKTEDWGDKIEIISGGSIEKHGTLTWADNETFGSSGEFIHGFINKCQEDANNTNDKLPDTIAIHTYTGPYNPEFRDAPDEDYPDTEMKYRLNELFDICDNEGYIPNFSITEYGFSPSQSSDWGAYGASQVSQALYYLRTTLLQATIQGDGSGACLPGIGWKDIQYFQHPKNGVVIDTGFFNNDSGYGTSRKIRYVPRELFGSSTLGLDSDDYVIITPYETTGPIVIDYTAWCAWRDPETVYSDEAWVAIWRYVPNTSYIGTGSGSRTVDVDAVFGGSYDETVYQFDFDSSPPSLVTLQSNKYSLTVQANTPTSGKTRITISDNDTNDSHKIVSDNPIFIRFVEP